MLLTYTIINIKTQLMVFMHGMYQYAYHIYMYMRNNKHNDLQAM